MGISALKEIFSSELELVKLTKDRDDHQYYFALLITNNMSQVVRQLRK